jgi:hypothetical protein
MLLENLENRQLLSFGDDNVVVGPSLNDPPFIRPVEVAIGAGDKIVTTGGNPLARFNADGACDTTFVAGLFRGDQTTGSFAHDLTLDDRGNIVVVGQEERDDGAVSLSVITVLAPDGWVHPAYDDAADFSYLPFDRRSAAEGVAIQDDGDIIVSGEYESTTMKLARVRGVAAPEGEGTGLTARYYSNMDFSGCPTRWSIPTRSPSASSAA